MNTNLWNYQPDTDEYYDFEKELIAFQDVGNTSVDLRLTFHTKSHECWVTVLLHNDDGDTVDLGAKYIPWEAGLATLRADGITIPEELL